MLNTAAKLQRRLLSHGHEIETRAAHRFEGPTGSGHQFSCGYTPSRDVLCDYPDARNTGVKGAMGDVPYEPRP